MEKNGKAAVVFKVILKLLAALTCLYFFICSLDFLATSFRLLAGRNAGKVFAQSELLQNPIVGVMMGVLATVLVQSSSTTTSIIVGMVASDILQVQQGIPMVMGANIGTSVTNTIVSITQMGNPSQFEKAFSCAVVHDIFNWLSVICLLPVEVFTGYLYHLTSAITSAIKVEKGEKPPDILKAITKPLTKAVIQIDKKVLEGWSLSSPDYENVTTLLKAGCKKKTGDLPSPIAGSETPDNKTDDYHHAGGEEYQCGYLFAGWGLSDTWLGIILLAISLFILCFCLVLLVKILNSLMEDKAADVIKNVLNANIPYVPWLTGYLAMIVGAGVTFLVQSSSVFTSTLTPLVGTGLFSLERAYPLTLGSNLGTTTTGLLAALASDGDRLRFALQIALCHLGFNISGILIFYPIPFMRWPIPLSKVMGKTVAQYRWFAIIYLIFMFFLFPLYIFGLSLLGPIAIYVGFIPFFFIFIVVILINVIQTKWPTILPTALKDWSFLPEWLRSLDPYDRAIMKLNCCQRFKVQDEKEETTDDVEMQGQENKGYQ